MQVENINTSDGPAANDKKKNTRTRKVGLFIIHVDYATVSYIIGCWFITVKRFIYYVASHIRNF